MQLEAINPFFPMGINLKEMSLKLLMNAILARLIIKSFPVTLVILCEQ